MRGGGTGLAQAERSASTLDRLDASANVQKAQAHARLGNCYRAVDTDAQIVVVDKRGLVRRILIGWDPANQAPLRQFVEELLAEPATAG
jgi:hypothetical protein